LLNFLDKFYLNVKIFKRKNNCKESKTNREINQIKKHKGDKKIFKRGIFCFLLLNKERSLKEKNKKQNFFVGVIFFFFFLTYN
jgi:hypothetical protein